MEKVDLIGNRSCGFSESLAVKRTNILKSMLFKHLDVRHEINQANVKPFHYESLPSLDFSRILAVMRIKDGIEGSGDRLDRWQHAGITNMRGYQEFRH